MNKYLASKVSLQRPLSVRMRPTEIALLLLVLLFGIVLLGITVEEALLQTLLLFVFVTIAGLWLAHNTASKVGDRKLRILGSFWMIKVTVTLILLYSGWLPMLDESAGSWGYDAQRYYQYSQELLANDWNRVSIGLNYFGIVYYYAAIFYIFGVNPVLPALVNAFITFSCIMFIIHAAYSFAPYFNKKSYYISGLVLIPEVLWYDVMTSRETLMAVLLAIVILGIGSVLANVKKVNISGTAIVLLAIFGILAVRTSMILSVVLSIVIMVALIRNRRVSGLVLKFGLVALLLGALLGGSIIQGMMGSIDIDYFAKLSSLQNFEKNIIRASEVNWSENSLGLLLVPNSLLEMFIFLPFRMVLYLAAPLPNITVSLSGLIVGEYFEWERLMTFPTSVLMLLGFPYVLAGSSHAWRNRIQFPALLVIPIGFWTTFVAVAGGNNLIHERYRLMFTLLLFACMWLGFTQSRVSSVKRWATLWYVLLAAAAVFYMGYKFL
jgi:hypothetical protein